MLTIRSIRAQAVAEAWTEHADAAPFENAKFLEECLAPTGEWIVSG